MNGSLERITRELCEHDADQVAIGVVLDEHLACWAEYDERMIDL